MKRCRLLNASGVPIESRRPGLRVVVALLAIASSSAAGAEAEQASRLVWQAPPTTNVHSEEVNFRSGAASLSGTLFVPDSASAVPAVVAFHSASDATRDRPLYRHLVEMLVPLGMAVLIFDRRNSGQSTGPSAAGDFNVLANDGIAARRFLEQDKRIDSRRIGYWGLSQGGWLAALAARRDPNAAFAISVSAPLTTADVQMRYAVANILRIRGFSEADVQQATAARLAVDDFMRGKVSRSYAQRILDAAARTPWFKYAYLSRTFSDPNKSGWAREMRNDPLEAVRDIEVPTLLVYGAVDPWVPVAASVARLEELAARNQRIAYTVIDGADHAMMTSATPLAQIDTEATAKQAPEAPAYFGTLASWLAQQGFIGRRSPAADARD